MIQEFSGELITKLLLAACVAALPLIAIFVLRRGTRGFIALVSIVASWGLEPEQASHIREWLVSYETDARAAISGQGRSTVLTEFMIFLRAWSLLVSIKTLRDGAKAVSGQPVPRSTEAASREVPFRAPAFGYYQSLNVVTKTSNGYFAYGSCGEPSLRVFVELTPDSSAIERFEIGGQWYDGDSEAGRAIDEAIQSKFHTSLLSAAR